MRHPDGRLAPTHIPPLSVIQEVETAINLFRDRIPPIFADIPRSSEDDYDGVSDPWWIALHANLYTAEMMMFKEMALHQRGAYETAVRCARGLVILVRRIPPDSWAHVGEIKPSHYFRI